MASVTQITQLLYSEDPQSSVGRLAFYHYLKNACDGELSFTQDVVGQFVDDCLQYQYWRQNAEILGKDLKDILEKLIKREVIDWTLPEAVYPQNVQTLSIDSDEDFRCLVEKACQKGSLGEEHRLLPTDGQRITTLTLLSTGGLRVRTFSRVAKICRGELLLLPPQTDLEYSSGLDFLLGRNQKILFEGFQTALFKLSGHEFSGRLVQGHLFQKAGVIQASDFSHHQELFFAIKSIERHFIAPESDPFYQELIDLLEKSYHLLNEKHPEARRIAPLALQKGQLALRNIFPKDKLLLLLVNNIDYLLHAGYQSPMKTESAKKCQNPRPLPS